MTSQERIDQLSAYRQQLWSQGVPDPEEIARVERKLQEAYEDRRIERAQRSHGTRKQIFHRARIEFEIEKLMTGDDD